MKWGMDSLSAHGIVTQILSQYQTVFLIHVHVIINDYGKQTCLQSSNLFQILQAVF